MKKRYDMLSSDTENRLKWEDTYYDKDDISICIDDDWKDLDYYAFLCFMKCNFDTEYDKNPWRAFKIKMKKIWFIIRGKDYCYSDTVMTKADFEEFKKYVNQF